MLMRDDINQTGIPYTSYTFIYMYSVIN